MKSYNLAGTEIQMPDLVRTGAPGEAEHAFAVALDAANLFASQKHAVENDQHLSTTGKQAKLAPMASQLWKTIFSSAKALQGERLKIETRTAELYGIGVPTTPYQIQQDLERRTWWNAQPAATGCALPPLATGNDSGLSARTGQGLYRGPARTAMNAVVDTFI